LKVDFLKPTPAGHELVLRARPVTVGERKVVVEVHVYAGDQRTVRADVIAVKLPESMDRAITEGGTSG
jgi:acyl-coenzyme A thioesterase PaaI-like protein